MSDPTEREVRDAIETIQSSYSYDPPSRWLEAHTLLRSLRLRLQDQFRPYARIARVGWWVGVGTLVGLGWALLVDRYNLLTRLSDAFGSTVAFGLFMLAIAAPSLIIDASSGLARWLATRRYPLMKLKDAVDASAVRFEDKYSAAIAGASA